MSKFLTIGPAIARTRTFSLSLRRLVVYAWCIGLIAGCGAHNRRATDPEDAASHNIPWFCQVGQSDQDWDCIRNEQIAADPKPERHPPPLERPRKAKKRTVSSTSSRVAATPAEAPPDPEPKSVGQSAPASRSVIASADTPPYVALSYRPKKPVAILDLPRDFWAVQLLAVSSKQVLENYAITNNISGMSAARIAVNNELYYVLLLGVYETRANAEEAILFLPPPFDAKPPWIRTVGSLQQAMLAGDRIASSDRPQQ